MTKEEVESIVQTAAKTAAKEAIKDTFLLMGVSIDRDGDVLQMQKDFQHLRESREGREEFVKRGRNALMAVFITATLAILAKGLWAEAHDYILRVFGGSS